MKKTTSTTLEYTADEINHIISQAIGEAENVTLKNAEFNPETQVLTFTADTGYDPDEPAVQIPLPGPVSRRKYVRAPLGYTRKAGLSEFIFAEFSEGHQIPEDVLLKACQDAGYNSKISNIRAQMRQKGITEIHPQIWQLKKSE